MTYNADLANAQEQRSLAALDAIIEEASASGDLYYQGEADGERGKNPQHPESIPYWQGYCKGLRDFWLNKQGKNQSFKGEF